MIRIPCCLPLVAVLALACSAFAAPGDSPTMNPGSEDQSNDMFGKNRPKDAQTEITAKTDAVFDSTANTADFSGSVVVKDPQFTLYCDTLHVILNKDRKGLQEAIAVGNVVIIQDNKDENGKVNRSTARSGKAHFTPSTGDITLTINPSVQSGPNLQIATDPSTVMVLNRKGTSRTTGPSRSVIVESNDPNKQ